VRRALAGLFFLAAGCGLVLDVDPGAGDAAPSFDANGRDGMVGRRDGSTRTDGSTVDPEDASASDSGHADASPGDGGRTMDPDATMPMCAASFESLELVCGGVGGPVSLRVDLSARFAGCGCARAIATATDAVGLRWTISDEMLEGERAVFDETTPFVLGGGLVDRVYEVTVCCYDAMGSEVTCMSMPGLRASCA
jgi:hypothetical protein